MWEELHRKNYPSCPRVHLASKQVARVASVDSVAAALAGPAAVASVVQVDSAAVASVDALAEPGASAVPVASVVASVAVASAALVVAQVDLADDAALDEVLVRVAWVPGLGRKVLHQQDYAERVLAVREERKGLGLAVGLLALGHEEQVHLGDSSACRVFPAAEAFLA